MTRNSESVFFLIAFHGKREQFSKREIESKTNVQIADVRKDSFSRDYLSYEGIDAPQNTTLEGSQEIDPLPLISHPLLLRNPHRAVSLPLHKLMAILYAQASDRHFRFVLLRIAC